MIRIGIIAFIALSLFLGQTDLPLFTHVCHGMGKTWTSVAKPPKGCCSNRKKDLPSGTENLRLPKSCSTIEKSRCCEDHINYVSLSVQLIHQVVKSFLPDPVSPGVTPSFIDLRLSPHALNNEVGIVHVHGPPGKPSGREWLIAHQLLLC